MDEIKIVKYQKSDYLEFRDFARAAFHSKYILSDEKFLDWQYLSLNSALVLAKKGEDIMGFFGYKDFLYKVYSETKNVRAVMNLFADEKYRMAGVGPMLAREVFNSSNYILVSSYNDAAQKLYRHFRVGWTEAGDLNRFFAVLAPHKLMDGFKIPHLPPPFAKEGGKSIRGFTIPHLNPPPSAEGGGKLKIEKSTEVSKEFDEFWQKVRTRYSVTIERSSEYLRWRYLDHPFFAYQFLAARRDGKLTGFLVYRLEEADSSRQGEAKAEGFKIARIIDFIADEWAEVSLLQEFLSRARSDGAQAADFMFSGLLYRESLQTVGFFDVAGTDFEKFPIRFNPLSYSKFVINIAYDIPAPLSDGYLTKGDSDQDRPNPH